MAARRRLRGGHRGQVDDGSDRPLEKLNAFLDQHKDEINSALSDLAKSLAALTERGVSELGNVNWEQAAKDLLDVAHSMAEFIRSLAGFIKSMEELNERSKTWWITKFFDNAASGNLVTPLPDGPGFFSSHGPGVSGSDLSDEAGGIWGGVKGWWRSHAPGWLGGGNKGVGGWWTPDRMSHAVDRLTKEAGLSREGAAGLVARWAAVKSPGGSTSVNRKSGAQGIGQWLGDRQNPLTASGDFDKNLTAAINELNGRERVAGDALRAAKTPAEGARGASMFERAEGYNPLTGTDYYTGSTPVDRVLRTLDKRVAAAAAQLAKPASSGGAHPATIDWSNPGAPGWAAINAALPVGASSASATSNDNRQINASVTNTVHVVALDPQTAAAMVGAHLDRSAGTYSATFKGRRSRRLSPNCPLSCPLEVLNARPPRIEAATRVAEQDHGGEGGRAPQRTDA